MIEGLVLLDMASVIALLFVILIGLPHGAFDGAIANHLGAGRSFATAAKFITSYCAAAGLVIAIWIMFPAVTLTLFLMISMIHFGRGDAAAKSGRFYDAGFASWRFTDFRHYLFPAIKRHPAI